MSNDFCLAAAGRARRIACALSVCCALSATRTAAQDLPAQTAPTDPPAPSAQQAPTPPAQGEPSPPAQAEPSPPAQAADVSAAPPASQDAAEETPPRKPVAAEPAPLTVAQLSPETAEPPPPAPEVAEPTGFKPEIHYGVGLRTQILGLKADEGATTTIVPDVDDGLIMNDIAIRPYIYGSFHEKVAFEANLEAWAGIPGANAEVHILDAVFKFQLHDLFQIWVGRFLPPADRSDLSGPFFLNSWLYPLEMGYPPSITAGRDNGFAVWGQALEGMIRYQVGLFNLDGGPVRPMARFTLNLLDPESETPFYYNSSTYYGEKGTILALAVSGGYEKDGLGAEDWKAVQSDVLFELPLAGGALNAEGAFYWYDSDDMRLMTLVSYLLPRIPLQPNARVMATRLGAEIDPLVVLDAGVNLILRGHDLRLALLYRGDYDLNSDLQSHAAVLGFQGQIWP